MKSTPLATSTEYGPKPYLLVIWEAESVGFCPREGQKSDWSNGEYMGDIAPGIKFYVALHPQSKLELCRIFFKGVLLTGRATMTTWEHSIDTFTIAGEDDDEPLKRAQDISERWLPRFRRSCFLTSRLFGTRVRTPADSMTEEMVWTRWMRDQERLFLQEAAAP